LRYVSSEYARFAGCFAILAEDSGPRNAVRGGSHANMESTMSVWNDRKDALESHEFRMGLERGRLAVALDLLTDALVLTGQHGVYCQSARQPGKPAMDIQIISTCLTDAKELVASVMEELKRARSQPS
jgi:hypothetical protein